MRDYSVRWVALSALLLVTGLGCGDDGGTDDPTLDMGPIGSDMGPGLDLGPDLGPDPADAFVPSDAACPPGMVGDDCADCAAGYQDEDGDGSCTLGCDATGADALDCGDHGACDDGTGTRACACDEGYDGDTCEDCEAGWTLEGSECVLVPGVMDGLRLWYDASDEASVVTNDSDEVTSLSSRVGSFPLVSPSGMRPVLEADVYNGRPAIRFSSDSRLASTGSTDALAGDDYDIFVVAGPLGLVAGRAIVSTRTGSNYGTILETSTGGYRFVHRSPAATSGGDAVVTTRPASVPDLIRVARAGFGLSTFLRIDVADGADLDANTDTLTPVTTGAVGVNQAFVLGSGPMNFNGHVAEVLVYDRPLTFAEATTVSTYLRSKWGL